MMISRFISTFCLHFLSGCLFHGPEEEATAPLRSAVRDSLLAADAARGDAATRQTLATAAYAEVGGAPPAGGAPALTPELPPTLALPRGRRSDALRQVRAADSAFALAADLQGTGVAFASFIAPQGVVFSGSEIVIGTEAVRALYNEQQRAGGTLNWRPVYADAAESGDLGMTVGESVFTGRGANGTVVQRFGKYLTIWKKQPGGAWSFVVDG